MTKHRDLSPRSTTCERIADRVCRLTEPWTEHVSQVLVEPDPRGAGYARRAVSRPLEFPSLLDQLRHPATGSTVGVRSSSASRPPVSLEGISLLEDIADEVTTWVWRVDPSSRPTAVAAAVVALGQQALSMPADDLTRELTSLARRATASVSDRLRRLARLAPTLDEGVLWDLDRAVASWWVRARVVTSWGDPPLMPHIRCPQCSALGKVRVRVDPLAATCVECGAAWDSLSIAEFGEHVRMASQAQAQTTARLVESRPCAVCGQVHAGLIPDDEDHRPGVLRGAGPAGAR